MNEITKPTNGHIVLITTMLLMVVFGSVHAFSVFLLPMEIHYQATRSAVSLIYSVTLMSLTFAVFLGHRLYGLVRPSLFVLVFCLLASLGLIITAFTDRLFLAYLGFGLMFGFANGLAYGFGLHICAQTNPNNKGLAIGLVTASYALGPILAPWLLSKLIENYSLSGGLLGFALAVVTVMPIAVFAYYKSNVRLQLSNTSVNNNIEIKPNSKRLISLLWIAYGLAVTAGLMSIGHATGIAKQGGVNIELIVIAPIIIALFNMVGSLLGGWMIDRFKPKISLCTLPILSAISLLALSQFLSGQETLLGLAVVGFSYGAIIAAYPAVIACLFGAIDSIRVYGLIFTAWGAAGFLGPWLAGLFYDAQGNYLVALLLAAIAGVLSATVAYIALKEDSSKIE